MSPDNGTMNANKRNKKTITGGGKVKKEFLRQEIQRERDQGRESWLPTARNMSGISPMT